MSARDKKDYSIPLRNLVAIVFSIFIIELAIMFLLRLVEVSPLIESLVDSLFLIILAFPFLYFLLYRPLITQIERSERAEKNLLSAQNFLQYLVNTIPNPIFYKDTSGTYLGCNKAFERFLGKTENEIVGKTVYDMGPKELADKYHQMDDDLFQKGGTQIYESQVKHADGKKHDVIFYKAPFNKPDGSLGGLVGVTVDITERKKAETSLKESRRKLKEAKDTAEAASLAKSEFLASMSHEIRTPMNVILGMADILKEVELSPEHKRSVKILNNAGETLLHLLDDILDLSKVEAGRLKLEDLAFDLEELLSEIDSFMGIAAKEKSLKLSKHIEPDAPVNLVGDPKRLRQVLFNIVSNAIKFTEKGRIDINVRKRGGKNGTVELEFYVRDTGIGISEDKLDIIFEKFTQADSTTTRDFGGTGLGTAISKKLVEMMGGKIWVESEVGKGSTFYFTVKLKIAETSEIEKSIEKEVQEKIISWEKPLKILIAEDSEDNLLLMQMYLGKTPHIVDIAENGKVAVEKFKSSDYDIVLMDMEMPIMSGYEAAKEIRRWEAKETEKQTPIVALTAHALTEHKQKSLEAGCTVHITKPIKKRLFLETIYEYSRASHHK